MATRLNGHPAAVVLTPPERDYYGIEKHWAEAWTIVRVQ